MIYVILIYYTQFFCFVWEEVSQLIFYLFRNVNFRGKIEFCESSINKTKVTLTCITII